MILATVDLKVTSILPMNFKSIALSVQEKQFKIDFQDGCNSRNLRFPITMIKLLAFQFRRRKEKKKKKKKKKKDFHLGFPNGMILAIFISTSHPDERF